MKKQKINLILKKTTVSKLNDEEMKNVKGGWTETTTAPIITIGGSGITCWQSSVDASVDPPIWESCQRS
jgi:bacteriocin-like protein